MHAPGLYLPFFGRINIIFLIMNLGMLSSDPSSFSLLGDSLSAESIGSLLLTHSLGLTASVISGETVQLCLGLGRYGC